MTATIGGEIRGTFLEINNTPEVRRTERRKDGGMRPIFKKGLSVKTKIILEPLIQCFPEVGLISMNFIDVEGEWLWHDDTGAALHRFSDYRDASDLHRQINRLEGQGLINSVTALDAAAGVDDAIDECRAHYAIVEEVRQVRQKASWFERMIAAFFWG